MKIPNPRMESEKQTFRIMSGGSDITPPPINETGSVLKFLKREMEYHQTHEGNNSSSGSSSGFPDCLTVYRSQVCNVDLMMMRKNSPSEADTAVVPDGFRLQDFLTMRWLDRGGDRKPKNIVNMGGSAAVDAEYFENLDLIKEGNIHEVLPGKCTPRPAALSESLFQIYHYDGTKEQRDYRNDIRGRYGRRQGGTRPQVSGCRKRGAADLRPWLKGFVDMVGPREAQRLLRGSGSTTGWPPFRGGGSVGPLHGVANDTMRGS